MVRASADLSSCCIYGLDPAFPAPGGNGLSGIDTEEVMQPDRLKRLSGAAAA